MKREPVKIKRKFSNSLIENEYTDDKNNENELCYNLKDNNSINDLKILKVNN
jgi:hypothetical protein